MDAIQRSDEIIRKALEGALNRGLARRYGPVDQNTVDAFTARLADAGVDMYELDEVLKEGDPEKITD